MDVMACPISRSGNFKPQPGYVQAIFPDQECSVWLDHELDIISRSGNNNDDCRSYPNQMGYVLTGRNRAGSHLPLALAACHRFNTDSIPKRSIEPAFAN